MKPRDICDRDGINTATFIGVMKQTFPKYSNAANSLANHSEETGVCLTNAAQRIFKAPREEKRKKPCKFTFRLDNALGWRLRALALRLGKSLQDITEEAIKEYLRRNE